MSIHLGPQAEALIRDKVDSGRYAGADEVVLAAIRLLDDHERLLHLRSLLAVGLDQADQGELVDYSPALLDDLDQRVEDRYLRGERPNPDVCP